MDIGTVWSVINSAETSSLPEAVWHQDVEVGSGFFISLLQRWDIASEFPSVFYEVTPFEKVCSGEEEIESQSTPTYGLRLPNELAIVDATLGSSGDDAMEVKAASMPSSPRIQERRVPLLVRLSENKRLMAMQFSPTMVRIGIPDTIVDGEQTKIYSNCKHWTVELAASAKDSYVPVASRPENLPTIQKTSTNDKNSETILPGTGLFWLDQSYGKNARGDDYQDHMFVMVTTKSLLCYTVTLNSLKKENATVSMKLSHHFSHSQACAAWWHPKSFVLVVGSQKQTKAPGSMISTLPDHLPGDPRSKIEQCLTLQTYFFAKGPFTSRREVLRNPLLLPLRLERPPPVRFQGFPAGSPTADTLAGGPAAAEATTPECAAEASLSSSPSSSKSSDRQRQKMPPRCVSVVSLYGKAYIVDISAETFLTGSGKLCMDINLHELDQENCTVSIRKHQQRVSLPKRINSNKEDVLFMVLDNLLCVSLRRSKLHLFLDIQDVGSDCAYVVEKISSNSEQEYLRPSTLAKFVSPSYLFLPQTGLVLPLAIDLERLAPSVAKHSRCNFSMLLRRHQSGREIALCRFSTVGALAEPVQRLKWIEHVASACARCYSLSSETTAQLQWDLHCTLRIMFQCALLNAGSEFLPICNAATLPNTVRPSSAVVIHQEEVLTRVFLPKTKKILADDMITEAEIHVLHRVAELAVAYMGALERNGSIACPSLPLFVFALLWRLGDTCAIQSLLKYRTWTTKSQSRRSPTFLSTKLHVSVLMAIVEQLPFGSWCTEVDGLKQKDGFLSTLRRRTLNLATAMLSSRNDYRFAAEHIRQLLLHDRLCDAVSVAGAVCDAADAQDATSEARAALVYARRCNGGSDFFAVALGCWTSGIGAKVSSSLNRQRQLLKSFLIKWDPVYLNEHVLFGVVGTVKQQGWDDHDLITMPKIRRRPHLSRRPSWIGASCSRRAGDHYNHENQFYCRWTCWGMG